MGSSSKTSFALRMQFGLHQDPQTITKKLLQLVRQAPVEELLVFFYAEDLNLGHEPLESAQRWLDHSRPYRTALAEAGVKISLNPWVTLLHCGRGRRLRPDQPWQAMMDYTGQESAAAVCPLDEGWRTYYARLLDMYAREPFRVIWVEDDIRLHNHGSLRWGGCFCPRHVAEFNRRAGTRAGREEIVAACTAVGQPHPWRAIWMDMWDETQCQLIASWRQIVEPHGPRLGLMSSSPEQHAAEGRRWEHWWPALAGEKPPVHRPHFWGYGELTPDQFPARMAMLDQNRSIQPAEIESGPEIENHPYGAWNKSFRQTAAELALAQILGSTTQNISLYDFLGNDPDDEPQRADFLRRYRPTMDFLADEFPMGMQSSGVGIPWSQDAGRAIHLQPGQEGRWESLICPLRGWAHWLGAAGVAFSACESPALNALSGPVVWAFRDEQIRRWLHAGVLLDGPAAAILLARGFGELIGLRGGRTITQNEVLYSLEHGTDPAFALRAGADISVNCEWAHSRQLFQGELLPGARLASDLRGPRQDVVGHGLILFQNPLGGRVAIVPWNAQSPAIMNIQRAVQLTRALGFLDPGNSYGWVEDAPWLVPQFLHGSTGWRGAVWNVSADAVERFTVHPPKDMAGIRSAIQVDANGQRRAAVIDGPAIRLSVPLHQWEFVVLR